MYGLDNRGLPFKVEDMDLAEEVIKLRGQKDPFVVVDLLVKAWAKRAPEEVEAQIIQVSNYREDLIDKTYGQTKNGKDQERRFKLSFPKTLMLMIRCVYSPEELPMNETFFTRFAKEYPMFKIADKI